MLSRPVGQVAPRLTNVKGRTERADVVDNITGGSGKRVSDVIGTVVANGEDNGIREVG